jgi:hypothetical protein
MRENSGATLSGLLQVIACEFRRQYIYIYTYIHIYIHTYIHIRLLLVSSADKLEIKAAEATNSFDLPFHGAHGGTRPTRPRESERRCTENPVVRSSIVHFTRALPEMAAYSLSMHLFALRQGVRRDLCWCWSS